jgi:hypothetical protein
MIREFINDIIIHKLTSAKVLVFYDPTQFYLELLPDLSKQTYIVDLRESVLTAREKAYEYFNTNLVGDEKATLLIYSPFEAPLDEQSKIDDPFFIFTLGKSYFPFSASDKYETICKRCFPDKEQQIIELFSQGVPDFDTIDALSEGYTYAKLQTLTGGKSEKEILLVLMTADEIQSAKLTKDKTWLKEYKRLAQYLGIDSIAKNFEQVNDELWRVMLISEFVFDLPIQLPSKLQSVTKVKEEHKSLVFDLLKRIRNNKFCELIYIEKANKTEKQFGLAQEFKNETDLGEIVTFSFEDNTYFNQFVCLLQDNKLGAAETIIENNKENIWPQHDEDRGKIWFLAVYAIEICKLTNNKIKPPKTSKEIIQYYADELYKVDMAHRHFEMILAQLINGNNFVDILTRIVRGNYRVFTDEWQKIFQASISEWPVEGIQFNTRVFDKYITPSLKSKKKIAFILVDALRFELGKELETSLRRHFDIRLSPACAYLPTVTKFGMAALLPDAEKILSLEPVNGKLEAHLEGKPALNLQARRNYLIEKLGDRCDIVTLENLLAGYQKNPDLILITTNEIDSAGENLSLNALSAIHQGIQNLVRGFIVLRNLGYDHMIIATDHGFMLYPDFQPGDNVSKPIGDWTMQKNRSLAGSGHAPDNVLSFNPKDIGINSSVNQFIFLKQYAVFEKNLQYFHEGLSMQETIIPLLEISVPKIKKESQVQVTLTYRGKSEGSITTRRPMIELSCFQEGEIGFECLSIKLEAISNKILVGGPIKSEVINDLTKLAEVYPGQAYKIPFEIDEDFEGSVEVIASDPITNKTYAILKLSTNYLD